MNKLGIVIIGYKNVRGIERLLTSLDQVDFTGDTDVKLIFSIDYSGDNSVESIAEKYNWEHGEKIILAHRTNMGLKKHIMSCGNYLIKYDLSAIAVLEDDIYVAPQMYSYMKNAVEFYKNDPNIAGISLYKHEFNINARQPFIDYHDGGDTFFVQYAMSWGQVWLREQWDDFVQWYADKKWKQMDAKYLPQNILKWKNSWLKFHIMYCIDKNKYFVYPRVSLTTDFSDVGEHNRQIVTSMQVKLCMEKATKWKFSSFYQTKAVYDAFFESEMLKTAVGLDRTEIDLYGMKTYYPNTEYVLTRKRLPYKVEKSWGLYLRPIEANIYMNIPGQDIFLYNLSVSGPLQKHRIKDKVRSLEYNLKGINLLCVENVAYCAKQFSFLVRNKLRRTIKGLIKK